MQKKEIVIEIQTVKANPEIIAATFLLFGFGVCAYAQNCTVTFEAYAGPDIDVCKGGQVNLNGVIGGSASRCEWKGGMGTFEPDRTTLEAHYTPAENEKDTVTLTLEGFNPRYKQCAPAQSKINLRIHREPHISAGGNKRVADDSKVMLHSELAGDAMLLTWKTDGSGTFSDANKADAVYQPSKVDLENRKVQLTIVAEPWPGCPPDSAEVGVTFYKNQTPAAGKKK